MSSGIKLAERDLSPFYCGRINNGLESLRWGECPFCRDDLLTLQIDDDHCLLWCGAGCDPTKVFAALGDDVPDWCVSITELVDAWIATRRLRAVWTAQRRRDRRRRAA